MRYSVLASRYAKALFDLAVENKHQDRVFSDLRGFRSVWETDRGLTQYFLSPVVKASEKEVAMKKAIEGKGFSQEVENFLLLLARKDRLALFEQVVEAYQANADEANGVTRGLVRAPSALSAEGRAKIEETIARATHKRVILSYQEDPTLIGGLTVKVGGYAFDDTIISHLRRLKEDLTRRAH